MTNEEKTRKQEEILDSLPLQPHGRLLLAPRMGKTKLILDIIKKNKPESILWVTPSADLAKKDIPSEFLKWGAEEFLEILTTSTWKGLPKIKGDFEMIIFDEEQFATHNNLKSFFDQEVTFGYVISMTGTPTRNREKHNLYKAFDLDILYSLSINEAVDLGILADYNINIVRVQMSKDKNLEAGNTNKKFLTSEVAQYSYLHKMAENVIGTNAKGSLFKILARMKAIQTSPSKTKVLEFLHKYLQGRKISFCPSKKQAELISDNVFHGTTSSIHLDNFTEGKINDLALVNKGGTGYTFEGLEHLIIAQADSDSNGLTSQKISRALLHQGDRKAKIWIICLDKTKDNDWIQSLLESGFDMSKVSVFDFETDKELILKH